MRKIVLDVRQIETPAALHIYMQYMFRFPEWYGRNLDALYDMLGEMTEPTCVVLLYTENVRGEMAVFLKKLRAVFCDAAMENACLTFEERKA